MSVPLLDLKAQYATIKEEVNAAIQRVMESQHFILGPEVTALEAEIAEYTHSSYAIGVSSGSDALLVALMVLDIQPNDEVIMPPYTFFATAGAVARLGAKPVFVDIDPVSYNLDPTLLEAAITDKTRVIIPVHLYGQMADMNPIMEIANRHNLIVIEDAAQAIGSEYQGKRAGSIGHMACFSFFPSKNLGGIGDGGMVTSNDEALANKLKIFRNHGHSPKYFNKFIGGNFRLDAIQAAVLRVKLPYLDGWTTARQQNANRYRQLFAEAEINHVGLPEEAADVRHIYNQFVIRSSQRDALQAYLKAEGIGTEIYYPCPMHLQECFQYLGLSQGQFPHSENAANESLALPIYPELTDDMLATVVQAIADFKA